MSTATSTILLAASLLQNAGGSGIRIIDGDTFKAGSETIRIANIDAPETDGSCMNERMLASLARKRLASLLEVGGFEIARSKTDRFGRTLATVKSRIGDIGKLLVDEGLAREWVEQYRPGLERWCGRSEIELNYDMAISLFCAGHGFESEFRSFVEGTVATYGRDGYSQEQVIMDLMEFGTAYAGKLDLEKEAGDNPGLGRFFCEAHAPR